MEKIPNEIWLKIFSYFEVQDLGRCAMVSKQFQEIAYERGLWKKLPISLVRKRVPIEFIQRIFERGTPYLNLYRAEVFGDPLNFAKPNSLKYLVLKIQNDVMKNILASCTRLEKLGCRVTYEGDDMANEMPQYIRQNKESLKCLQLEYIPLNILDPLGMRSARLVDSINECNQLEELDFQWFESHNYNLCKNLPQNLKKLQLNFRIELEDFKVLVVRCNKLEDLFFNIQCCYNSTCRHIDELISIIVGSSLSDTLINLSLSMNRIVIDEKQFDAQILKLG